MQVQAIRALLLIVKQLDISEAIVGAGILPVLVRLLKESTTDEVLYHTANFTTELCVQ